MLKDTKKWRTGHGKNTLLQPGSRGLPNPESEKTKGCNLYWVKSETTAKKVKRNLPFLPHVYCLPLSRLTSLKAHFSLLITSLEYFFCHNFVQDVAFLQRAHRLQCRIRTLVTPGKETPNEYINKGRRKHSPNKTIPATETCTGSLIKCDNQYNKEKLNSCQLSDRHCAC